jgi:chemotaxis protein methyltransferase CheR
VHGSDEQEAQTEALEIDLLLRGVAEHHGFDFRGYARPGLRRRVKEAMLAEGVGTVSALQERVLRDAGSLARFVEMVSVQRAPMFANPEMYLVLRRDVVPLLRTYPFVSIWVAGCSTGEELYALAIVLHEQGLLARCRLYATDVSDVVVERARQGRFPLADMDDHAAAYRQAGGLGDFGAFFRLDGEEAVMAPFLRPSLIFSQHNLVCDGAFNEFQLVVCRNVLRQFDPPLRGRVLEVLHGSVKRLGVLALGARDTLRGTGLESGYRQIGTGSGLGLHRRIE